MKHRISFGFILLGVGLMFVPLALEIWDKGWDIFQFSWNIWENEARKRAMFWRHWEWYAGAFTATILGYLTLYLGDRR